LTRCASAGRAGSTRRRLSATSSPSLARAAASAPIRSSMARGRPHDRRRRAGGLRPFELHGERARSRPGRPPPAATASPRPRSARGRARPSSRWQGPASRHSQARCRPRRSASAGPRPGHAGSAGRRPVQDRGRPVTGTHRAVAQPSRPIRNRSNSAARFRAARSPGGRPHHDRAALQVVVGPLDGLRGAPQQPCPRLLGRRRRREQERPRLAAPVSSHFRNDGVQNVGLRSVVSVRTSTASESAKYAIRPPLRYTSVLGQHEAGQRRAARAHPSAVRAGRPALRASQPHLLGAPAFGLGHPARASTSPAGPSRAR